jgi:hypothetical protein
VVAHAVTIRAIKAAPQVSQGFLVVHSGSYCPGNKNLFSRLISGEAGWYELKQGGKQ